MKNKDFGNYIKALREQKNIPQRIVAHKLDIDTSTLSKIELGERQITIDMIPGLAEILGVDFKSLQIKFISEKLLSDYKEQPYFVEAVKTMLTKIKK